MAVRLWEVLLLLMGLAGCVTAHNTHPGDQSQSAPIALAEGVYMFRGAAEEIDVQNRGRVGNAGFIIGETGVVVIDTGTSYQHGRAMLASIEKITEKPVRLVLITHTRQEFLFGAEAFRERGIPIQMHRKAAELMAARCENCLKSLRRQLGEVEMHGTTMFKPDHVFEFSHEIDIGGRKLSIHYYNHSSGPGDIAVLDPQTGIVFAGGLLDNQRIPDVQDSDLVMWKIALDDIRKVGATLFVPGHGPVGQTEVVDNVARYLEQLGTKMHELLQKGVALSEASDAAELPDFKAWRQYDTIHRRNASIVFLRFERESIFR